jgi:protein gp37
VTGRSAIEWTDDTWNVVTGCTKLSPGCANCYIERQTPMRIAKRGFAAGEIPVELHPERLSRIPRGPRVFTCSMGDLFHEDVPEHFIQDVFEVMAAHPDRTFQVLTKRPERARELLVPKPGEYPSFIELVARWVPRGAASFECLPRNIWMGTSIENARFTWRADVLREIPAAVRFISAEPLLGSLLTVSESSRRNPDSDLGRASDAAPGDTMLDSLTVRKPVDLTGIDWLIVGGESGGRDARPMHPEWARELRDACLGAVQEPCSFCGDESNAPLHVWRMCACDCHPKRTGPAFFFKQWGSWAATIAGTYLAREGQDYVIARGAPYSDFVPDTTLGTGDDIVYYAGVSPKSGGRFLDGRQWNEMPTAFPPSA